MHHWVTRLRGMAGRVLRPGGRAVVLLYHRIGHDTDSYGLCVTPEHFEEHLSVVRVEARPGRVGELARDVRAGTVADRTVCISFDDGYADNLLVAKPLLERHGVPATVFATTGRAGRDREFWWDELERAFLEADHVPRHLELEIGGRHHAWDLGADAVRAAGDDRWDRPWHLLDDTPPTARHGAFRDAHALIKPMPAAERTRVIDALRAWSGIASTRVRESRRAMEPGELAELARGDLVEVGAHTVTHPSLPAQSVTVQRGEIGRSKRDLEQWVGGPVAGFAYPYGDFDASSVAAAREAGFEYACSCLYRAAHPGDDPFAIPRVEVRDIDGDVLTDLLRWQLR